MRASTQQARLDELLQGTELRKRMSRTLQNVKSGLKVGLTIATGFSALATVLRISAGPGAFRPFGLTWAETVAVYYLALSLGGCAYGAMLPLKRYAVGAALMGFLLVFPMYSGFVVLIGLGQKTIPSVDVGLIIGAIISAFVGATLGLTIWIDDNKKRVDRAETVGSDERRRDDRES